MKFFLRVIALVSIGAAQYAQGDEFVPTSDMSLGQGGRYGQFAALLPDGRVLMAGGYNGSNLASAEIYDPATDTFSWTQNDLSVGRGFGKTVVLQNQKVLLIGGGNFDETGGLMAADLFDPATGLFSATGPMHAARTDMVGVALSNGSVLVAGGMDPDGVTRLSSAEIYNPATGTFSLTGSMAVPRDNAVAVLLPSGKVLVAGGGHGNGDSYSEAELYDPNTGIFTATGSMTIGRDDATATLLNNGDVLVVGGAMNDSPLGTSDLYHPATGTFSASQATLTPRDFATATLLGDGRVLVVGGQGETHGLGDTGALSDAWIYDPATDRFNATASMPTARYYFPAIMLGDGRVFVAGGYDNEGVVSTTAIFGVNEEIFANGFEVP